MGRNRVGNSWRYVLATAAIALTVACSGDDGITNSDVIQVDTVPLFAAGVPANGPGQCLLDDVIDAGFINSGDVQCTSEDVDIAIASATTYSVNGGPFVTLASTGGKILCSPGDLVDVNGSAQVINHAQERYDVGLWVGLSGADALTGAQCNHYNLVAGANGSTNIDGDQCGDVQANITVDVPLGILDNLTCVDGDPDPNVTALTISACAGWQNHIDGAERVCPTGTGGSFRLGTTPETPAKCKCEPLSLPLDIRGTITIIKDAVPDAGVNFGFTSTGAAPLGGAFTLDDDADPTLSNTQVFTNVVAGNYSVTEGADPTGWQFTSLSCTSTGSGTSTSTSGKVATITLGAGGAVTCTYVNTKQGTITIIKDAVPDAAQNFGFTSTGSAPLGGAFNLDDDGDPTLSNTQTFNNVPPGGYTVTEGADPAGWQFTSLNCTSSGTGTSTSTAGKVATITVGAGGQVTCTYVNTQQGTITIIKDAVPNDVQNFGFTSTGGAPLGGAFNLDDDGDPTLSNTQVFSNVPPGAYSVTEGADPAGWQFTSLNCSASGAGTSASTLGKVATITMGAAGAVTCTYVNTKNGSITIVKDAQSPATDPEDFGFTATGTGVSSPFTLDDDADPTNSNQIVFGDLQPGTRTFTEGAETNWVLTDISCTGQTASTIAFVGANADPAFQAGDNQVSVGLAAGENVTCTYVNKRLARLIVLKILIGGGTQSFEFSRTGIANFFLQDGQSNNSNFTLQPGTYRVCELDQAVAFATTGTLDNVAVQLFNPDGAQDLGNRCFNVVLNFGDSKTIAFINAVPPGGDARTIGYWKNWSSCAQSNGKQFEKAVAAGNFDATLDGNLPQTIGNLTLDAEDCAEAVAILNKSDIVTGQKRASDPAYNLAAQLLAAKLNVTAGAGTCAAALTAIADAQTLLVAINFTGTGSYTNTMTAAQKTQANTLAGILDSYNNNTLCP